MHGHKTSHLPIRYFLALLWAHPILHISTIRVKTLKSFQTPETALTTQRKEREDFDFQQHLCNNLKSRKIFNIFFGIRVSFNQGFTFVPCV